MRTAARFQAAARGGHLLLREAVGPDAVCLGGLDGQPHLLERAGQEPPDAVGLMPMSA